MNIVQVQFPSDYTGKPYGKEYSYKCTIDGIKVGDMVIAPTYQGDKDACVSSIDVDSESISYPVENLKTITERKEINTDARE